MRLLVFPQYAYPWNHAVVNTVFETLLPARGHHVDMIRPMANVTGITRVEAPWGGTVIGFPDEPLGGRWHNMRRSARLRRWLADALRMFADRTFDAVLVRNDLVHASVAAHEARRRGVPFLYQLSSPDAEFTITRGRERGGLAGGYMRVRGYAGLAVRRRLTRRADAVLAISDALRRHMVDVDGVSERRAFAFPMGVRAGARPDDREIAAVRRELRLPEGRTMVFSGVLDPVREPAWMLDVFDQVRARIPDAAFLVVTYQSAEDERRRAFESAARARGGNVCVVGPVPFHDVPRYLCAADVAVSPYRPMFEHAVVSPTKTLEAMAMGVPVVGNLEVVEHQLLLETVGGGLGVRYDVNDFANAVVALMRDSERRAAMGVAGGEWVRAHRSYDHLTDFLEQILRSLGSPSLLREVPHVP